VGQGEKEVSARAPAHLLAPVDRRGEAGALVAAGAGWLYGGALPREWARRYPDIVPLNQRTFGSAQFSSLEELAEAIGETRERGGRFALVLNAPFYLEEQLPLALELAGFAQRAGAEAAIVGDPGLISVLRGAVPSLAIHLSTMAMAANPAAVELFRGMGMTRLILPRHLALGEIAALARSSPGTDFEAFLLVGKCPNVEGACSFLHDSPAQAWPCEWPFAASFADGSPLPPDLAAGLAPLRQSERRDACGLCALPALLAAGVTGFKVVGRGAPTARKVALVEAAARGLEAATAAGPAWMEECRRSYRSLFGRGCGARSCYYPELWEAG
jgi:U32 family peptidase